MTDIVERLRGLRFVHVPVASQLMAEAAAEIERLRLTYAEREAIEDAAGICEEHAEKYDGTDSSPTSDTLRSLLARLAVK